MSLILMGVLFIVMGIVFHPIIKTEWERVSLLYEEDEKWKAFDTRIAANAKIMREICEKDDQK